MLYSVRERYDMAARTLDLAVVVEATDSTVMAGDAADEDRDLVATAVAQLDAGSTAWSARGWIAGAGAWLRAAATAAGREPAGPVEQVRAWAVSTVLRVPTTGGYVYFKSSAAMPLFADEAAVTAALAGMFPGAVPAPLAVDPGRGWIATAGFGDPIGPDAPVPARVDLVRDFARLQIAAAGRVGELSGCVDRRLGRRPRRVAQRPAPAPASDRRRIRPAPGVRGRVARALRRTRGPRRAGFADPRRPASGQRGPHNQRAPVLRLDRRRDRPSVP
jgi:hypothetical protein